MPLFAGQKLGPYEILSPIGAGGMGEVYRARDARLERDVAIKVLPAELSQDRERLARFEREARAAGRLKHPNVLVDNSDFLEHEFPVLTVFFNTPKIKHWNPTGGHVRP